MPTAADLFVESWGDGTPVVLVHGSLATAIDEWQSQRPLADEGFRLVVFDRRGYGRSAAAEGEDFLRDADDIAALMGDGAHLIGHSYGGLGAMVAAARRPAATLSLTLLEPAAFSLGQDDPAGRALVDRVRALWNLPIPDDAWVVRFLEIVGSNPDELPPELVAAAVPLVSVFRRGRAVWSDGLPLGALAAASFPKLVVSGGHSAGFDAICDDLARRIGAARREIAGAGHEIQFTGSPINDALLALWRRTSATTRVDYRAAVPQDAAACVRLRGMTRENAVSVGRLAAAGITVETWRRDIETGKLPGHVCTSAGDIVGYGFGDRDTGEVVVLALLPAFENRGIGKRLLARVVEDLRACGHERLFLGCARDPSTRSHGFYRHLGWRSTGAFDDNGDEVLELVLGERGT